MNSSRRVPHAVLCLCPSVVILGSHINIININALYIIGLVRKADLIDGANTKKKYIKN